MVNGKCSVFFSIYSTKYLMALISGKTKEKPKKFRHSSKKTGDSIRQRQTQSHEKDAVDTVLNEDKDDQLKMVMYKVGIM